MQVFSVDGESGITVKYSSITTSTQFDSNLLHPPSQASHYFKFTSGGTNTPAVGETLTGLTSAATAKIVAVVLISGTFGAGSAVGIIFVNEVSGTFQAENLDHTNGATDDMTIAENALVLRFKGMRAKSALAQAKTASINFVEDSSLVTVESGVNPGFTMDAKQTYVIKSWNDLQNFRFINETASNSATFHVAFRY